jgi:hypothetical protein
MIRRRSVITGICSLVAARTAMKPVSIIPISATSRSRVNRTAAPVAFRIHGWDQNDLSRTEKGGQHVVVIHLTNSWRSAWL